VAPYRATIASYSAARHPRRLVQLLTVLGALLAFPLWHSTLDHRLSTQLVRPPLHHQRRILEEVPAEAIEERAASDTKSNKNAFTSTGLYHLWK
jgi:hypothetical protein